MPHSTGLECPVCFDEISSTEASALRTCGHVFCNSCITEFLSSNVGNRKCPKCRVYVPYRENPLKLFVDCSVPDGRSHASPSPPRHAPASASTASSEDDDASFIQALLEQVHTSSASAAAAKEKIAQLTLKSSVLIKEKTNLEKCLQKSKNLSDTERNDARRRLAELERSRDTAAKNSDQLKRENAFLQTNNTNLTARITANEAVVKDLQKTIRGERQASQTRIQRELAVHHLQLASERKKLELFTEESEARAREIEKEFAAKVAELEETEKAVHAQFELVRGQRDEAWQVMEQFRAQGWHPTQTNASLVNNLVLLTRERDTLAELDAARTVECLKMSSDYEAVIRERDALIAEKAVYMKAGAQLEDQVTELTRRLSHPQPAFQFAGPTSLSFTHFR